MQGKPVKPAKKLQLKRIVITKSASGWDVVRERAEDGESCKGCKTLSDAFAYIEAIYDENGEYKPPTKGVIVKGEIA